MQVLFSLGDSFESERLDIISFVRCAVQGRAVSMDDNQRSFTLGFGSLEMESPRAAGREKERSTSSPSNGRG